MGRRGVAALLVLQVSALAVSAENVTEEATAQMESLPPKPFGVGLGPTFIGGRDTDKAGTDLSLKIYKQFLQYKNLLFATPPNDKAYYDRWTERSQCIGGCGSNARCKAGICICNFDESYLQAYGQCHWNQTAAFLGNDEKYRKPKPPPRPDWCFCKDKNGHKEVCDKFRNDKACIVPTYPNEFDHNSQFCGSGDHQFCHSKDINMFCSDETMLDPRDNVVKNLCRCRKDMQFDTKNMECRIYLNADCTYAEKIDIEKKRPEGDKLTEILNILQQDRVVIDTRGPVAGEDGQSDYDTDAGYDRKMVDTAFCNLIESEASEYVSHLVGEFTILGLSVAGFFLACCASCLTCCCCCKCCESVRAKIRRMDPRNMMKDMNNRNAQNGQSNLPTTEMAALGAVAVGEYINNREEAGDEARIAAMQGGQPMAPGYAPLPQGYPQGGLPYPQAGASPYPGYAPVPSGYPSAPAGGYVPPADQGPLGAVMNMAPELALAGAGAYSGNNAMLAMGAVSAAEKMGDSEDREDRIRAGILQNVPAPPGYMGGPVAQAGTQPLPPSNFNYPRQQM